MDTKLFVCLSCSRTIAHFFHQVNRDKKWADLGRLLGHGGIPGLSTQLKNSYTRVILPYEHFSERVRLSSLSSPKERKPDAEVNGVKTPVSSRTIDLARDGSPMDISSEPGSPLTNTSSPLSEVPEEPDVNGVGNGHAESPSARRSARNKMSNSPPSMSLPIH